MNQAEGEGVETGPFHLLKKLVQGCREGEVYYALASRDAEDGDLRVFFRSYSLQRGRFARELADAAGADPRNWMALDDRKRDRGPIPVRDDSPRRYSHLLADCLRHDEVVVNLYEGVLAADLPAGIRAILGRQCMEVRSARDRIRDLQSLAKPD